MVFPLRLRRRPWGVSSSVVNIRMSRSLRCSWSVYLHPSDGNINIKQAVVWQPQSRDSSSWWTERRLSWRAERAGIDFHVSALWREYRWMETELQFEDVSLRLIFHIKVISVLNISHLLHIVLFSRLLSHFVRGVTWRPLYVWLCVTVVASDPCYITQLTHRTRLKSHWSINRTSIRSAVWRMTQSFTSCALFWYFWHHSRWLITAFTWKYCRIVSI